MHESTSLRATSRLDCSMCSVGFGPSKRLSPRVFQESVASALKASAVNSERIAVESVVVERVCHVGTIGRLLPMVAYAAVMSSLERSISSSTNPEYSCCASLQSVLSGRVVDCAAGCPCVSLLSRPAACTFCDSPVFSGSCTVCGPTAVAEAEGCVPELASVRELVVSGLLVLLLQAGRSSDCERLAAGGFWSVCDWPGVGSPGGVGM